MKHKRILVVTLLFVLVSSVLLGLWILPRLSALNAYAQQFEFVQNSNSLHLTFYGDPEGVRGALEMFQYFSLEKLQWRGALPKPYPPQPGPPPPEGTIELNLKSGKLEKIGDAFWNLSATGLNSHVVVADLVDVLVQARNVNAGIEFWTLDTLPALNITAVLTGNVNVSLSLSVLPLPGLMQAAYASNCERFVISVCVIKPIEISIENLSEGERINGDVEIRARVKTAPGIKAENVHWWVQGKEDRNKECHFEGPMWYDDVDGLWKAVWNSYHGGNGWYELRAKAEGVQENVQGFRFGVEDFITVEVDNPWVESWLIGPDWKRDMHGIMMELQQNGNIWHWQTWFQINPEWTDVSLTAPQYWEDGKIQFQKWTIQDTPWESTDPTITFTPEIQSLLYNGGRARALRCIYIETPPPP